MLEAIAAQPIATGIAYHSIIATIHPGLPPHAMTDGFVRYTSAHLDGAESERVVSTTHVCVEADPEVIAEVRRILMEHRNEAEGATARTVELVRGIRGAGMSFPLRANFVQGCVAEPSFDASFGKGAQFPSRLATIIIERVAIALRTPRGQCEYTPLYPPFVRGEH